MTSETSTPADAFDRLGHETRVAILRALVGHRRENPGADGLSFADLRERVGVRDSGQFNYHLDKLRGRFIEQDGETYRLTYAGEVTAAAILAGSYDTDISLGPTELDDSCFVGGCTEPITAEYEDGRLTLSCVEGHHLGTSIPPAAVADRDIEQTLWLADEQMRTHVRYLGQQTCLKCKGHLQTAARTDIDDEDMAVFYESTCERCGTVYSLPGWLVGLLHPAVEGLCWDRGVLTEETKLWELRQLVDDIAYTVESTDPLSVRIEFTVRGESRTVELDQHAKASLGSI